MFSLKRKKPKDLKEDNSILINELIGLEQRIQGVELSCAKIESFIKEIRDQENTDVGNQIQVALNQYKNSFEIEKESMERKLRAANEEVKRLKNIEKTVFNLQNANDELVQSAIKSSFNVARILENIGSVDKMTENITNMTIRKIKEWSL